MEGEGINILISSLGCSVVDYCLALKEDFNYFSDFHVHTMNDLAMDLNHQDLSMSDHSVLLYIMKEESIICWQQKKGDSTPHQDWI